jgi:hypothetical protein
MSLGAQILEFKLVEPEERSLPAMICAMILGCSMIGYILYVTWFIRNMRWTFNDPGCKEKYGALGENIDFWKNSGQYYQYPLMLLRRTVYALIPIIFFGRPYF